MPPWFGLPWRAKDAQAPAICFDRRSLSGYLTSRSSSGCFRRVERLLPAVEDRRVVGEVIHLRGRLTQGRLPLPLRDGIHPCSAVAGDGEENVAGRACRPRLRVA